MSKDTELAEDKSRPNLDEACFRAIDPSELLNSQSPMHAPRIALLYGSVRARSFSRLAVQEAARILERFGAETRVFNPSGLPLPDIRGTIGTFYYFATDLSRYEEGNTEMGGILKRLVFDGDVGRTELVGPPNPVVKAQQREIQAKGPNLGAADKAALADLATREDVRIPITVRWNRQQRRATIEIGDNTVTLEEGQWSKWLTL